MKSYKIIFAGTPEFAAVTLKALIDSPHQVVAVYTQPDRPAGRGRKLTPSPVKELAQQHDLPVYQPLSLRNEEEQQKLKALQADLMVVVAYGLLLPKAVLEAPRLGCLNVHGSLLPRWRGAAPIQRAILMGDKVTGITIMQMDEGLDTGAMLSKVECPIQDLDTSATLYDQLAKLGSLALLETLNSFEDIKPQKQDDALATYAHKIKKEEGLLDWADSAINLLRKIRAFNPWPVAYFDTIRVWDADVIQADVSMVEPGTIIQASTSGIDIATGDGILRLLQLQMPGGKVLSAADILNSRKTEFAVGKNLRATSC